MSEDELRALEAILTRPAGSFPLPSATTVRDALRSRGFANSADDAATLYGAAGRLVAEGRRLRDVVGRALAAGHCTPDRKSDPGEVLILHCELTRRDLLAGAAEVERLRAVLGNIAEVTAPATAAAIARVALSLTLPADSPPPACD